MKQNQSLQRHRSVALRTYDWDDAVCEDTSGNPVTLQQCHDALATHEGRMAQAAALLKVGLVGFGRMVQTIPALNELVLLHRELLLDEAEGTVRKAVQEGDGLLAMQVLRSAGKHRGWNERDGTASPDTKIEIVYVNDWRAVNTYSADEDVIDADEEEEQVPGLVSTECTAPPELDTPKEPPLDNKPE